MSLFYTPKEVSEIFDITYRQLQYWDKTNFIKPSYRRRGKYRLYSFRDLIIIKAATEQREHGDSIQAMRRGIRSLERVLSIVDSPLEKLIIENKGMEYRATDGTIYRDPERDMKSENHTFAVKELMDSINELFHYKNERGETH